MVNLPPLSCLSRISNLKPLRDSCFHNLNGYVRRVVNLRLKGASLFWCRASAEAILLLRSYYKAGRWNLLKRMATSHLALLEA